MDNITAFPDINQIKDEAALWAVKVQGYTYQTGQGIPAAEAVALRTWLAQSERHRECFITMLGAWDAMGMLEELADILPLADAAPEPPAAGPTVAGGYRGLNSGLNSGLKAGLGYLARGLARLGIGMPAYAGPSRNSGYIVSGFVLAVSLCLWMIITPGTQRYQTGTGEQASYTLADGSVITLNTNSQLEVRYSDQRRSVTLLQGEVNFDVAKDRSRPFVVHAGTGLLWAVGTAFNVRYTEGYVGVLVSEGIVKVFPDTVAELPTLSTSQALAEAQQVSGAEQTTAPPEQPALLLAGEAVRFDRALADKEALTPAAMQKRLAWQSGVLQFEGETLEQAVEEIARYTDYRLMIVDASIRQLRVGGRFKTDDIDILLGSLAKSLNIHMTEGSEGQLLFSAQKHPTIKQ